jgi:hypothetical protein
MKTLEGTATHSQTSFAIPGGGENGAGVRNICMFRINLQQIEFRPCRPFSIADGDLVRIAGNEKNGLFRAYACVNLTSGQRAHGGIWGSIFSAAALLPFGLFFSLILSLILGSWAWYAFLIFIGLSMSSLLFALRNFGASRMLSSSTSRITQGH